MCSMYFTLGLPKPFVSPTIPSHLALKHLMPRVSGTSYIRLRFYCSFRSMQLVSGSSVPWNTRPSQHEFAIQFVLRLWCGNKTLVELHNRKQRESEEHSISGNDSTRVQSKSILYISSEQCIERGSNLFYRFTRSRKSSLICLASVAGSLKSA